MHHAPKHLRDAFDELVLKLDRARKDDKRLKIVQQIDELLRNHLYGWDAVHLHPPKHYKLRARSRMTSVPAPTPLPMRVYSPGEKLTNADLAGLRLDRPSRHKLRSVIRLHPGYATYELPRGKTIESWRKDELLEGAIMLGIDVHEVLGLPKSLPLTPLEQAIALTYPNGAEPTMPAAPEAAVPTDDDPESIECKGFARELAEREGLHSETRQYFKLVSKLNRPLAPGERDRIIDYYTAPTVQ